MAFGANEM